MLTDAERVRLAAEFDHERSEMFFARAVVLVEGQTEHLSLPIVFRALGHDPDAEGIAIVEVGGKSNLPLAARLLGELELRLARSRRPSPRSCRRRSGSARIVG